jgi:DNA-binding MarR family transcriptional regulator
MKKHDWIATAIEIRILIGILTKLTRQELQEHLDTCGVEMSTLDHGVVRLLRYHPFTISELSKHMLLEPASLVPVVDALERKNWIRRSTDPHDRRRTPLILTEEGERVLANLPMASTDSPFLKTLEKMGAARAEELLLLLRELVQGLSPNKELVGELSRTVQLQLGGRSASLSDKKGQR